MSCVTAQDYMLHSWGKTVMVNSEQLLNQIWTELKLRQKHQSDCCSVTPIHPDCYSHLSYLIQKYLLITEWFKRFYYAATHRPTCACLYPTDRAWRSLYIKPRWLTTPGRWSPSQHVCSHKLPQPEQCCKKNTQTILHFQNTRQTQWLRHKGTSNSPQRRHPPWAELLTQTGCLRAIWVYTKLCSAACVVLQKEGRQLLSLYHGVFDLQGPGE